MSLSTDVMIGALIVALAGAGYGAWQQRSVSSLKQDLSEARSAAQAAHDALKRTEAALVVEAARRAQRDATVARLRKEISDAPDSDDGDVAPVLRRTLDELRTRSDGGAEATR